MSSKWLVSVTIVCLLSGLLIAWQLQAHANSTSLSKDPTKYNLVRIIEKQQKDAGDLEAEIGELRLWLDDFYAQPSPEEGKIATRQAELKELQHDLGLTPVSGPGVIVSLDDKVGLEAAQKKDPNIDPQEYIVHDKNLLYLVNELRSAGATAIAVNNQRIVYSSEIRCVGTLIKINGEFQPPPYTIIALGDSEKLYETMIKAGELSFLRSKDYPVNLEKKDLLEVPAFKSSFSVRYTVPRKGAN